MNNLYIMNPVIKKKGEKSKRNKPKFNRIQKMRNQVKNLFSELLFGKN